MLFAAVTHLAEGVSLEILLALKVETFLICLVGTRGLTVFITEQQLILFLKTLIRNKASRYCRLE
jgi:DNA-binding TFAR19-related protein (PDSD5 family)